MPETVDALTMYSCGASINMAQFGMERSPSVKLSRTSIPSRPMFKYAGKEESLKSEYLKKISTDLKFDEAVVKDRCFHMLPYDEKYLWEAVNPTDIVPLPPKPRFPVGRHNSHGRDLRHMPCHLNHNKRQHLKPLQKDVATKALQLHKQAVHETPKLTASIDHVKDSEEYQGESVFLTENTENNSESRIPSLPPRKQDAYAIQQSVKDSKPVKKHEWDAYLLSNLSKNTANWIVHTRMSPTEEKSRLTNLLHDWHGEPDHIDLVRDDISDGELDEEKEVKKQKKKWKTKEATLLQEVYQQDDLPRPVARDPYSDDNVAPFYRQPAAVRRQKHVQDREQAAIQEQEPGAINSTAAVIEVTTYQPPPPPTLRDFVNPNVGDKLFDTDNMFQREWLTGSHQIYDKYGDKSKIVMSSQNTYNKQLQREYPQEPEDWYPSDNAGKKNATTLKKVARGMQRWKGLPVPIDDTAALNVMSPGYDSEMNQNTNLDTRKLIKKIPSLLQIIEDWRSKWHMSGLYADSTPDDLIRDMADIQPHVRLKAVATVGKAASYRPPVDPGIQLESEKHVDPVSTIPDRMFVALKCLLGDKHEQVQKTTAITLYSLGRPCDQAERILRVMLVAETSVDRWASARCLAHYGYADSDVISEIISQMLNADDAILHEQAIKLLQKLSLDGNLVHSLVGEQLNSSSWRHKVMACNIFPKLHGNINRDITNKLSDLMWKDWHSEVRKAAAHSLGRTGHGRDVHDDLKHHILEGNERTRLEAISKVGYLGIMTAKLLPAFLSCFDDEYVSVRMETCITSGNLRIQDEQVLAKLVHLATFDNVWKIKAIAIQALGKCGMVTEEIKDCLLWALRYEDQPGVRAEACHTMIRLDLKMDEVVEILQDRFLVETSNLVRDQIIEALKMFGICATEDMDMVAQIKNEVRKLCTRNIIASQITMNEVDEEKRENLHRMISDTEKRMNKPPINPYKEMVDKTELKTRQVLLTKWLCETDKERDASKVTMMKRLRAMSRVSSTMSLPHPAVQLSSESSTPEPSREGTFYTPTADREVAAILEEDETSMSEASGLKSRGMTRSSTAKATSPLTEETDDTVGSGTKSKAGRSSLASTSPGKATPFEVVILDTSESDVSSPSPTKGDRPQSVKFNEGDMTPRKGTGLLSPTRQTPPTPGLGVTESNALSLPGAESPTAKHGTGYFSEVRAMFSRQSDREREKMDIGAQHSFMAIEARYSQMDLDLDSVDNTFDNEYPSDAQISAMEITMTATQAVNIISDNITVTPDVTNEKESFIILTQLTDQETTKIPAVRITPDINVESHIVLVEQDGVNGQGETTLAEEKSTDFDEKESFISLTQLTDQETTKIPAVRITPDINVESHIVLVEQDGVNGQRETTLAEEKSTDVGIKFHQKIASPPPDFNVTFTDEDAKQVSIDTTKIQTPDIVIMDSDTAIQEDDSQQQSESEDNFTFSVPDIVIKDSDSIISESSESNSSDRVED